jgi:hypothetical protein
VVQSAAGQVVAEAKQVVQAQEMVEVLFAGEHGVKPRQFFAHDLCVQARPGISRSRQTNPYSHSPGRVQL